MPQLTVPLITRFAEVGAFLDLLQLILLVAVAYLLWRYMQAVRQVHTIGRFWLDRWSDPRGIGRIDGGAAREVMREAVGDRQIPNALMPPPVHSSDPDEHPSGHPQVSQNLRPLVSCLGEGKSRLYCITLRSKFDASITGWYTGSRWSTDHTRKKLFDHKEEAEPVAMALRELCPRNAGNINVETQGVDDTIPATSEGRRSRLDQPR
jgi:hypothetical protein